MVWQKVPDFIMTRSEVSQLFRGDLFGFAFKKMLFQFVILLTNIPLYSHWEQI